MLCWHRMYLARVGKLRVAAKLYAVLRTAVLMLGFTMRLHILSAGEGLDGKADCEQGRIAQLGMQARPGTLLHAVISCLCAICMSIVHLASYSQHRTATSVLLSSHAHASSAQTQEKEKAMS